MYCFQKCFRVLHIFVLNLFCLLHIICKVQVCFVLLHIYVLCIAHYCTSFLAQDIVTFMSFFHTLRLLLAVAPGQALAGLPARAAAAPGRDRLPWGLVEKQVSSL